MGGHNFDSDDLTNARMNRELKRNPPQQEPGMEDWDDTFSDSSLSGGGSFGSFGSSPGFGGPTPGFGADTGMNNFGGTQDLGGGGWGSQFGNSQTPFGQPMQQSQQVQGKSDDEKFWEVVGKATSASGGLIKDFIHSFSEFNNVRRLRMGKIIFVLTGLTVVLSIFLKVALGYKGWLHMIGGALVCVGPGFYLFLASYGDIIRNGADNDATQQEEQPSMQQQQEFNPEPDFSDSDFSDNDEFDFPDDDDEEEEFDEPFGDDDEDMFSNLVPDTTDLEGNMNSAVDAVDTYIDKGMITRQFLYDNIVPCLKSLNSNFDKVKVIDEDSEEFDKWDMYIQKSAEVLQPGNSEDYPVLVSAKEKLFYIQLEVERVKWLKNIQAFVDEIVNVYAFDADTHKVREGVYGLGVASGDRIWIKIMKGASAFVSLKDTYARVKDIILDSSNYLPIVLGIGSDGQVIWKDFKKMYSLLVTGKPRTGKSWFIKCVLAQMMFWLKPSQLQFVLLDPKGDTSDFNDIKTPHVRKFVSTDKAIVDELRYIVNVEAPRRKKIMKDMGGYIDFLDLKRDHPELDFPMLYVVIDEVVTLSERMDKEVKSEFQALLAQFVSQLPALGLRIFMVPHVVKNDIIKKTTSDLIPCRISVMGDPDHIESSTGTKPKDFPQRLTTMGDMAVRLDNNPTEFVHGAVLSDTNEGVKELYAFLARFWSKIEPESVRGSVLDTSSDSVTVEKKDVKVKVREQKRISSDDYNTLLDAANDEDDIDLGSLFEGE